MHRILSYQAKIKCFFILLYSLFLSNTTMLAQPIAAGMINSHKIEHGTYYSYIPKSCCATSEVLILVHGTIGRDECATEVAQQYTIRWAHYAEQHKTFLIVPVFDQENYGGTEGPGGGFRGLFGRIIGADQFLNNAFEHFKKSLLLSNEKFILYGHSAGGQFVSRYIVKYPEKIISAAISAAGTFAFPDPTVPWTNGMAKLTRKIKWGSDLEKEFSFSPNPDNYLKATQIPVYVVVGSKDTERIKNIAGQKGNNHVERAMYWVQGMNNLAAEKGLGSSIKLIIADGVGHNSQDLTPYCVRILFQH